MRREEAVEFFLRNFVVRVHQLSVHYSFGTQSVHLIKDQLDQAGLDKWFQTQIPATIDQIFSLFYFFII